MKTERQWAWKCPSEDLDEAGTASTEEPSQWGGASMIERYHLPMMEKERRRERERQRQKKGRRQEVHYT